MISQLSSEIEIVDVIDSVEDSVNWLKSMPKPDLLFMDIQLADGNSFSIFDNIELDVPIIFTTAYDQYAIEAFKVNSIDYILKPIEEEKLKQAWNKYLNLHDRPQLDYSNLLDFLKSKGEKVFKQRFLIKLGENYTYCSVREAKYFLSEVGHSYMINNEGKRFLIDEKLEVLETQLDPSQFFRINRKYIVHINSISKISSYFNSRLKLTILPESSDDIIVARDRVNDFKAWLNQ